jgi:hypothetical protein
VATRYQGLGASGGRNLGAMTAPTCDFCGTAAPGDELPLTWTTAVENGRTRVFCDRCSREHLRAIESKLDSEWW